MGAGMASILSNPIEYLKGVGPPRADLLKKELEIFTFRDLLELFPYRHIDKTVVTPISEAIMRADFVQVAGRLGNPEVVGDKKAKRLSATITDPTGSLELIWFQGINWIQKMLEAGRGYRIFGKVGFFNGHAQITHPEIELIVPDSDQPKHLEPVYPSTEKLKARGLGGRQIAKLVQSLFAMLRQTDLPENLPENLIKKHQLISRYTAFLHIHFPPNPAAFEVALRRLKFEELFIGQLRMGLLRQQRHRFSTGVVFTQVGRFFNEFYENHLPFELTNAQKKVIKEIRKDMGNGRQMNRLLQGDVGSGKTMVALLCLLLAADNGFQGCLMAPTEILARQHYQNISRMLQSMDLQVRLLTGNVKSAARKKILAELKDGVVDLLIGTHALIEDTVEFKQLGLAVVDEQHRFGVAQRARLWTKSSIPPHVLVMTATPIPRTLAMTAYGDLDYSVIDELPPNRKPIFTIHRSDRARPQVMDFVRAEVARGRQVYIIYPLIEESEKLDYENLFQGYENLKAWFPEPKYYISMVHGRQPNDVRETNMQRFRTNDTQIMVGTTVIEVGVDVPNASVMIIESAEKFGLSQLHQLRGRVGRGAEKSYCILLTGQKVSREAKERLTTMVATNDGFRIAEKDLELRGPGEIEGTRQSGALNLKLADLVADRELLELAGSEAAEIIEKDPGLSTAEHLPLKNFLAQLSGKTPWSRIS